MKTNKLLNLCLVALFGVTLSSCSDNGNFALFGNNKIYTLTINNDSPLMGSVSGSGEYKYKDQVTITISCNDGYGFDALFDGENVITRELTYTFEMPKKNLTYNAAFLANSYTVNLSCQDDSKGTITGSGTYQYNSSVTISFTGIGDSEFDGWYNGEECVSTLETYTFNMPSRNLNYVAKIKENEPDNLFTFGSYPQTKVSDQNLINSLKTKVGHLPNSTNPYSWTTYSWYISSSNSTKFAWYIDLDDDLDGINDYRAVYYTSYRPFNTSLTSEVKNTHQANNGFYINTIHFFKYEPLKWKVLNDDNNEKMLVCDKIIDNTEYNPHISKEKQDKTDYQGNTASVYSNNYKYSHLRTFLNTDFYQTAFSTEQQNEIKTKEVDNSVSSTAYNVNPYSCENTFDKVYAPSTKEMTTTEYGFVKGVDEKDPNKSLLVTDYATALGCYRNVGEVNKGGGAFYTRSPENISAYSVRAIYANGYANGYYLAYVNQGVVPAITISNN